MMEPGRDGKDVARYMFFTIEAMYLMQYFDQKEDVYDDYSENDTILE